MAHKRAAREAKQSNSPHPKVGAEKKKVLKITMMVLGTWRAVNTPQMLAKAKRQVGPKMEPDDS